MVLEKVRKSVSKAWIKLSKKERREVKEDLVRRGVMGGALAGAVGLAIVEPPTIVIVAPILGLTLAEQGVEEWYNMNPETRKFVELIERNLGEPLHKVAGTLKSLISPIGREIGREFRKLKRVI